MYDDIDYVIFGGLIVMKLTGNHLDELFGMDVPKKMIDHLAMYAHLKNRFDEVLIITQIFPGSHLTKIESLHIGDIISCVNNIPVKTLDDFRKAIKKVHTVDGEHYIKYKTKLNTVIVCNLKTLLNEEEFLADNFQYKKDFLFKEFIDQYSTLLDDKQSVQEDLDFSQQYKSSFDADKLYDDSISVNNDNTHTHLFTNQITHSHTKEDLLKEIENLPNYQPTEQNTMDESTNQNTIEQHHIQNNNIPDHILQQIMSGKFKNVNIN